MKKISLLLAISILITILPIASAAEFLQYDALQHKYAQQYCIETDVEGIVQDANGNYAMVDTDTKARSQMFIPVGRQDVLLTSEDSVKTLQSIEGLGQELKDDVVKLAKYAQAHKECACDDCNTVSIYSPDLLSTAQNVSYQYYDGHRMKVELITGDAHAGFVPLAKASNLEAVLSAIVDVGFAVASEAVPKQVSLFMSGLSLMREIYKHANANNVFPSSSNSSEVKIRFSYVIKYTFGELAHLSGDWLLGCVSSSATVSQYIFSYDFYTEGGKRKVAGELYVLGSPPMYTTNFNSGHLRTAWLNLSHPWHDGQIELIIGPKTFVLT